MLKGNILNVHTDEIYPAEIQIANGIIKCVKPIKGDFDYLILPGFVDAHIHIESSMLTPSRFAEAVVPQGTTSIIADPHEIANVMGLKGIEYMMKDAISVPLKIFFSAPSCVPSTAFETNGAKFGKNEIDKLLKNEYVVALGEIMNFKGVLEDDEGIREKIKIAKKYKKPIDGHAPLLSGDDLCKYVSFGISTDHECTKRGEVSEKKRVGLKIMIREGSSARNLKKLISEGGDFIVSDDVHPKDLLTGHMNRILAKAVDYGLDPIKAVKMVTLNPSIHYNLNIGSITPGKGADLVFVDDVEKFNVKKVYINGNLVSKDGKSLFNVNPIKIRNTFNLNEKKASDFEIYSELRNVKILLIEVIEGQILTERSEVLLNTVNRKIEANLNEDILKIAVVERYGHENVANGFVRGFGIKKGAIASSIAHDSHNILVVGTNSNDMAKAVNMIKNCNGGIVAISDKNYYILKLPIAGLMSTETADNVSNELNELHKRVHNMGCKLESPFMTLSFMGILVIPKLKISDKGLFDVEKFRLVDLIKQ
jgi:adenine deaminase